jgi:hypothetical protein
MLSARITFSPEEKKEVSARNAGAFLFGQHCESLPAGAAI